MQYNKDISGFRPIPKKEQVILFKQAKKGNRQSRDKLISSILQLSYTICQRFRTRSVSFEDLIGEANLCIVEKFNKWNPKGASFHTYMYRCIYNRLLEMRWKKEHNGIYIPRRTFNIINKIDEVNLDKISLKRKLDILSAIKMSKLESFDQRFHDVEEIRC